METQHPPRCWWFGVNNAHRRTTASGHVIFSEIAPLLAGAAPEFEWPYHKQSKRYYQIMRAGDRVLFWMGNGHYPNWGIFAFGYIRRIEASRGLSSSRYHLGVSYVPSSPLTPYPHNQCQETEITRFLQNVFGLGFRPLGKTFSNLGYPVSRPIITIDEVSPEQYDAVLRYARNHAGDIELTQVGAELAEEVSEEYLYPEGSVRRVYVNAYERSSEARAACLRHYGTRCFVCNLDLGDVYGAAGEGLVHVHHLRQISETEGKYDIDPVRDLRPVCPNCHAVIHRNRDVPYTIEQVQQFLYEKKNGRGEPTSSG